MLRASCVLAAAIAITGLAGLANANTVLPGDSSVNYATNFNGVFNVNSTGESHADVNSQAIANTASTVPATFEVKALSNTTTGYADAGIVLGLDGSLTLGQLQSVAINLNSGNAPTINLWLDTGDDGHFFAFDGSGNYTGLNGDSYFGATTTGSINESSSFGSLGTSAGVGTGTFTLSQLQSGLDSGINSNTKVALWIGDTASGRSESFSFINSVNVAAAPLPASVWSGMALLAGMGIYTGIKRKHARLA